jgi:Lrp/AsnC family leucine-responsive transcriptional regulator
MKTIDEIDERILRTLLKNARSKMVDIAKDCDVSITTIKNRIEKLKKEGIIIKEEMMIDPSYFGYHFLASIGIDLAQYQEENVFNAIKEKAKIIGINHLVGIYDLYFIVYVKTLEEVYDLKDAIQRHDDVNDVEMFIWNKAYFNFDNLRLKTPEE